MDEYKDALNVDRAAASRYYSGSVHVKTEQQKYLETLLSGFEPESIADIACGGGGVSFHLGLRYPQARFTLLDFNEDALCMAREATRNLDARCLNGSIHDLPFDAGAFDLVICWQTLSWIDRPEQALSELLRICRPGGRVYASSLFNLSHDVDVYSRVIDHTRPSASEGLGYAYNTYSQESVRRWVSGRADMCIHAFDIPMDLSHEGRGLGTYTIRCEDGRRLQVSAGMLLNWGVLDLRKT